MNSSNSTPPTSMPWYQRTVMFSVGLVLLTLLATAWVLKPNPAGKGTHQALGLPPCSFEQWFAKTWGKEKARCPSCGMTTSWAHMTKGHVIQSFQANTGGALLALVAMLVGPWMLISGTLGRWVVQKPSERVALIVGFTIVLVTLVDWGIRMTA